MNIEFKVGDIVVVRWPAPYRLGARGVVVSVSGLTRVRFKDTKTLCFLASELCIDVETTLLNAVSEHVEIQVR